MRLTRPVGHPLLPSAVSQPHRPPFDSHGRLLCARRRLFLCFHSIAAFSLRVEDSSGGPLEEEIPSEQPFAESRPSLLASQFDFLFSFHSLLI